MAAERVQRRLAAIMTADVVGYSHMMEAHEEGTLACLKALREKIFDPAVATHHGRIVKTTGDGALVEFASSVDALRCAVELQRHLNGRTQDTPESQRLRLRIGINIGDVIIEGDDIYGNGVNVATRLESLAEPGGICISGRVLDQVEKNVDVGFAYLGPQAVKNIDKPVNAYKVLLNPEDAGKFIDAPAPRVLWLAVTSLALLGAAGVAFWSFQGEPELRPASVERMAHALPDKPSIAVLPFTNMSDDPQQGYFADGMTEDLITDLAKISGLFVISRNSVFIYKDRPVEIRQVGEELGVRYVLEGSVRRFGDQVRITGQLIDATTGGHLWAEKYDGSVKSIFAFQDEVRAKIVDSLEVVLTPDEARTLVAAGTDSVEAYEAYLQGMALLNQAQQFFIDPLVEAEGWFKKAIELDPQYARAMAALAWRDYLVFVFSDDPYARKKMKQAFTLAERSLALQETATSYVVLSKRHFRPRAYGRFIDMGSDHAGAVALLEKARAIESGSADVLAELAYVLVFAGEVDRAAALIDQAKRLNPSYPVWYRRPSGMIHYFKGDYAAAAEDFQIWRDAEPVASGDGSLWLAAAQAMDGRMLASRDTIAPFRQQSPHATTHSLSRWLRFADSEMWKAVERGLLAAGVPPG